MHRSSGMTNESHRKTRLYHKITQDNNGDIELVHFADKMKIDDIGDLFELI